MEIPLVRIFRGPPASDTFPQSDGRHYTRLFWAWLVFRTLVWTTITYLTVWNPPLDLAEILAWGHCWVWGYSQHPPLPLWVGEIATFLTGGSIFGAYLASYAAIGVGFWAAWRLGCELLSPREAFFAVLALEGLVYFHFDANDLNHNVVLAATWALTVLCFFHALRDGRNRSWLMLGICMGLSMLAKYSFAFLFLAMLLYMILDPAVRNCWKRVGPYLAGAVALLMILPHAGWCLEHNFGPIRHMLHKSRASEHSWWSHLRYPGYFTFSQFVRLLPVLLILVPLTGWRWRLRKLTAEQRFGRNFLLAVVVGPVALHLLVSLVLGIELRDQWGFQLWTFVGIMVLFFVEREATGWEFAKVRRLALSFTLLFLAFTVARNLLGPSIGGKPHRIHFPGRPLAERLEQTWHQRYSEPIAIIAVRDDFMGHSVSWYMPERPLIYLPQAPEETPGVDDDDLNRRGGLIIWDVREGNDMPSSFEARFPTARQIDPVSVPYHAGWRLPPLQVGVAIVPPPAN